MNTRVLRFVVASILLGTLSFAQVPGLINYQGRLLDGTNLYSGTVPLLLRIYNDLSAGDLLLEDSNTVTFTDGLYSTWLGDNITAGSLTNALSETNLHIEVVVDGTTLSPREPVSSVLYAQMAASVPAGAITSAMLADEAVTSAKLASNTVTGTHIVDGTISNGDIAANAVTSDKVKDGTLEGKDVNAPTFSNVFWKVDGNKGTTAGTHILGTTDNEPLELHVYSTRALRIEPTIALVPNIIAGSDSNEVLSGAFGGTISGGGYFAGEPNRILDDMGTIGGGLGNTVGDGTPSDADFATIGGGRGNRSADSYATVGGGLTNQATGYGSTIAGGRANEARRFYTAIAGGRDNIADGDYAAVVGGSGNIATGEYAFAGGGFENQVLMDYSAIVGGYQNVIGASADYTVIGGGRLNTIDAGTEYAGIFAGRENYIGTFDYYSLVVGGTDNRIEGGWSAIVGGWHHRINAANSFIGGGQSNSIVGEYSVIGGGFANYANASGTVGGGRYNRAENSYSVAAGGQYNTAGQAHAVVAGGLSNNADGGKAFVGGGEGNEIIGPVEAVIAGGAFNSITGLSHNAVIGGGEANDINAGRRSVIGGGGTNRLTGDASVLAGGTANDLDGDYSVIGGGEKNAIASDNDWTVIAGGRANYVAAPYATIGGGGSNRITQVGSTIAGGGGWDALFVAYVPNVINGQFGFIGGGGRNAIDPNASGSGGDYCTIGGGYLNIIATNSGHFSTIAGGNDNLVNAGYGTIGGGLNNAVNGSYAMVPGGHNNEANGSYSFAAGRLAHAEHNGTFVWTDSQNATFSSTSDDQFLIRAQNGVGINTPSPLADLHVLGDSSLAWCMLAPNQPLNGGNSRLWFAEDHDGTLGMYFEYSGADDQLGLYGKSTSITYGPHLLINRNTGRIGIGTTNTAVGYQLSVGGAIRCEEVVVESGWADFVFEPDYPLATLDEVETHIREHKRLPDMPSAQEVQEKGVKVGEVEAQLLQKIEELTLHTIRQQKEIRTLQDQVASLQEEDRHE